MVDIWDSDHVSCVDHDMPVCLWIESIKDCVIGCIISFTSNMQAVQNMFYFS